MRILEADGEVHYWLRFAAGNGCLQNQELPAMETAPDFPYLFQKITLIQKILP